MDEYMIKDAFLSLRAYKAEKLLLQKRMAAEVQPSSDVFKRIEFMDHQIQRVEIWMALLSEDEAYVVKRHLVDGIDIGRIAVEYKDRWGEEFAKTDRSLRSYQRKALKKILLFESGRRPLDQESVQMKSDTF